MKIAILALLSIVGATKLKQGTADGHHHFPSTSQLYSKYLAQTKAKTAHTALSQIKNKVKSMTKQSAEEIFKGLDTDDDGKVTEAEYKEFITLMAGDLLVELSEAERAEAMDFAM